MPIRSASVVIFAALVTAGCARTPNSVELINVSYDPTRELYADINAAFTAEQSAKGVAISIKQLHCGSGPRLVR